MIIRRAALTDVPHIHRLANEIWPATYRELLSPEQLHFMLEENYSIASLTRQFGESDFFLAERDELPVAFASISLTVPDAGVFKLHKLYILPSEQGKGTGKIMINYLEALIRSKNGQIFELNVKRDNPALGFYKKLGFSVFKEADIPYHGFMLNDYIMQKEL